MNALENVRRCIEFEGPDHIPVTSPVFGREPEFWYIRLETPSYTPRVPGATEWGHTMKKTSVPNHGIPADLPIETWDMLADFRWPDARNPERYRSIPERLAAPEAGRRYVHLGWYVGLYDTILRLRGWQASMTDFVAEPAKIKDLIARVTDFMLAGIDTLSEKFPGRIHGILIPDDWGGQKAAFISIEMWEEFFGGPYREIGRHIHKAGMHFWLHSDGRINELLDTLIECGVDVVNMPSPTVVDIDEIAERFAGRICFANGVDIQKTLVRGTDDEIEDEARRLVEKWNTPKGGFIPFAEYNLRAIGAAPRRALAAVNAFRKYAWNLPPLSDEESRAFMARLEI